MRSAVPGSYVVHEGVLHTVDARVKLCALFLTTIVLFAKPQLAVMLGAGVLAAVLVVLSHMSAVSLVRAVRPVALLLLFSLIVNICVLDGSGDMVIAGQFGISYAGAERGIVAASRIVILLALSLVLSSTTTIMQLSDAVGWLLKPLDTIGVLATDLSMIVAVSLRLIPVCVAELDRIVVAQKARGARLNAGNLYTRLASWAQILTALLVVLFSHAEHLADAMRDRCYGTAKRTSLLSPLSAASKLIVLAAVVLTVGILVAL